MKQTGIFLAISLLFCCACRHKVGSANKTVAAPQAATIRVISQDPVTPETRKAADVAFRAYAERMNLAIGALEAPGPASAVTVGFDVPGFATKGDKIWEVRISGNFRPNRELRAIVWVHSESLKTYCVVGPWSDKRAD